MPTEDIIFFTIASLIGLGFIWLVYWSIGAVVSILNNPYIHYLSALKKSGGVENPGGIGELPQLPIKNPYWYRRLPYLVNERGKKSLLLVTDKGVLVHEKARYFWEIITPRGDIREPIVTRPFTFTPTATIASVTYQEEGDDGTVLAVKLKDGTTQRYSHCAQNNVFKEQLTYISEQLEAPSL